MQTGSIPYSKRKLTNWWLGAGLLLGLLLFTGHTGKTMARYAHPVQIAWQYKNQSGVSKQSSWYVQPLYYIETIAAATAADYKHSLLYCHRLVSVRFIQLDQITATIKTTCPLIRMQSFPEDSEALIFHSCAGPCSIAA